MNAVAQRHAALERANEVRIRNGITCRSIAALSMRDGLRAVADLIESNREPSNAITAGRLLRCCRFVGEDKALRMCRSVQAPQDVPVRSLTERQRRALAHLLRSKAATA